MSEAKWSRLLEIQRNGITERTIFGAIAITNDHGVLNRMESDPVIFGRSLMKPFQMRVVAQELDGALTWEEKAISLASHNGTDHQAEVAKGILPISEQTKMALPASLPMTGPRPGLEKSVWLNPCSGKHAAILKACKLKHWPQDGYLKTSHPYNQRFREELEQTLGISLETRVVAEDGCLLPTWTMTVSEIAMAFASLAPTRNEDWIWEAFHRHPDLIGGANRLDSTLNALHSNVLAKEGADGLLGLSIYTPKFEGGLGIVIKLAHGYDSYVMSRLAHELLAQLDIEMPKPAPLAGQQVVFSRAVLNLKSIFS
jgi:L-asparaginase